MKIALYDDYKLGLLNDEGPAGGGGRPRPAHPATRVEAKARR